MFNSIKLKLLVWFIVVFSVFFAGLDVFFYYELEDLVISLSDDHLKGEVQTLANLMAVEDEQGQLDKELAEIAVAAAGEYSEKLSGHYYQIVSEDGTVLVKSPSLSLADEALPIIPATFKEDYRTIEGPGGQPIRLITQSFRFSMGTLTFQAGDSLKDIYRLLSSFRNTILAVFPAVFIVCGVGIFLLTGWALKSLKSFTAKVGQITEENLSERIEQRGVVTELKPLAASFNTMLSRLEESFTRQKQFLSDASHELRTPTSIIKSFCDVTLNRERASADYKEAIRKIGDTVNRMCDIINRILVISRLDTKTIQFKPAKVDLLELMRDVKKLIEPSAANKGIEVRIEGRNVVTKGDREGLTEVFTNIVENAIKYNRPDGKVLINVNEYLADAVVTVEDTGIGIPETETEKIFDRFYRVDASRGVTVGSGLGLSIVRTIVEAHGGSVVVKSKLGEGSTFQVTLPKNPEARNGNA